jgi:hypothetical protein
MEVEEMVHRNSQTTTVLFASLCREKYNKLNGFKSTKDKWDTLKTSNGGDRITKRELLEGKHERFIMLKGKGMQKMYNRHKSMVNQVHNLRNKK